MPQLAAGEVLGHYRIEALLGEGGMGVVYRATDTDLGRPVALKTLRSDTSPEVLERFRREARAAARLHHPSIVALYEFRVEGSTGYLVMEYVEGQPLKKVIGGQAMQVRLLCTLGAQIADALAEAHANGVIHRDIKADNIIVTGRGVPKIMDFGLAKMREQQSGDAAQRTVLQTQLGMVLGTITHMPPEQALGVEVDDRADIFSFGVMLYEMATGKLPFVAATPQHTLALVLNSEPAPARSLNPAIPEALQSLIHRCLEKERESRPSASEVVEELKAIQSGKAPEIAKTQIMARPAMPAAPEARPSTPAREPTQDPSQAERRSPPPPGRGRPGLRDQVARPAAPPASRPASASAAATAPRRAPAPDPAAVRKARLAYDVIHGVFTVVKYGSIVFPLMFAIYFVAGGAMQQAAFESSAWLAVARRFAQPQINLVERLLPFRPVLRDWNLAALALAALWAVVRTLVLIPLENWQDRAQQNWLRTGSGK